jgi:hypothetical protein
MFFLFEEEEVQEVWDSRWQYVKKIGIGNMKRELRQQIERSFSSHDKAEVYCVYDGKWVVFGAVRLNMEETVEVVMKLIERVEKLHDIRFMVSGAKGWERRK